MKVSKTLTAATLAGAIFISTSGIFSAAAVSLSESKTYEQLFPDPNLAKVVASYCGEISTDTVNQDDLNQITTLSANPSDITIFDLTGIEYLNNLQEIDLAQMGVASIPSSIRYLSKLEKIDLSENQIVYVADELGQLTNLKELRLDHNRIKDFPTSLSNLPDLTTYTNSDQDLSLGNVPTKFIANSEITFSDDGEPVLTHVVKQVPAPKGGNEIGGNLAQDDPTTYASISAAVDEMLENLPVYTYEDSYTADAGATISYGDAGEIGHVNGEYEYVSDIDKYSVNGALPDGKYVGNFSEFSQFTDVNTIGSNAVARTTKTGYFTTYGDYWPEIPTSDTASNTDPVPNRGDDEETSAYYGDRIGTRNNKLKIGDVATRPSDNIPYGTQLTVTVRASDTNGSGQITKTMTVRDIMGATAPILDIWRWDSPEWFKGTPQRPNDIYFGQTYNKDRSFPNTSNFFTY